jgi:hypothetical protein
VSKNRSAAQKTLLVLEHHAKPLKELWAVVTQYVAASDAHLRSSRGGPNSWSIYGPNVAVYVSGRMNPWRLEIRDVLSMQTTVLRTRAQAIAWAEKVLVP